MFGLSALATMISVLSFPLIFVALLYPHFASSKGRWYGVGVYGGLSLGMMLVAVMTSPNPQANNQTWTWLDWLVMVLGSGLLLAFITRKISNIKKQAVMRRSIDGKKKGRSQQPRREGKKKHKP